jgi:hypothetical protein
MLEKDVPEKDVPEKDVPKKNMLEKNLAINEDAKLQGIIAVVPAEVLPNLATWLMQGEVFRFSITTLRKVEYKRKSLLTTSIFMGIFPYMAKDVVAKTRTTLNGPSGVLVVGPFSVVYRLIWTWSMIINDDFLLVCLEVIYDPAIGLGMRVTFECIFWQTAMEILQEGLNDGTLIHANFLANLSWSQITAFGKFTEM